MDVSDPKVASDLREGTDLKVASDLREVLLPPGQEIILFESIHEILARSLCLPFESYYVCRELLQLPKQSMRRFREQIKRMKDEAVMLLRRMGKPTQYSYYRNRAMYNEGWVWAEGSRSRTSAAVVAVGLISAFLRNL
ncbi:hypothetical protein GNI_007720 [Gregarina niphandrodes]|uniref:Uncharacterized protein n=1 Tax=Gregarina niphandrodes TaxID=110365 RepID=A0A023BD21_GRENI|nr:hypothetical protein GNI_007720 [Gregarina niphandrodes]EZG87222.1 hypothetical protein GNI_007720 [Gregarina niphandrodes]|eukprot:XP_011128685.1 hypothetical protein GNI_007720 [Gregarina niphandrodes]